MRIGIVWLVPLAAACFTKPPYQGAADDDTQLPDTPTAQGWLADYGFRKRVIVSAPDTVSEFPVGISLDSDNDLDRHARSDGRDIVVTAADGTTLLPSELAAYGNGGRLELWTRVPELTSSTEIYLYYGGPEATRNTDVWIGYAGVWHLSDDSADSGRDSTLPASNLIAFGGEIPAIADGAFGGAKELDGQNDSLSAGAPSKLAFDMSSFSYSLWVFQLSVIGDVIVNEDYNIPFYKGGTSGGEPGFCFMLADPWLAKVQQGIHIADPEFSTPVLGDWVHLAAIVDRDANELVVYMNGQLKQSHSLGLVGSLTSSEPLQIGRDAQQQPFHGRVDEVRIYNSALTPEQIRTEHANGSDPSFLAIGTEEKNPDSP